MSASALGVAGTAVVSYLLWLGWHRPKDVDPVTGDQTGPHEPWQVVGLALTLALVVAVAALLERPLAVAGAATVGLVVVFSADAATVPMDDASFWPIGAMLLAMGAWSGLALIALTSRALADLTARRLRRVPTP